MIKQFKGAVKSVSLIAGMCLFSLSVCAYGAATIDSSPRAIKKIQTLIGDLKGIDTSIVEINVHANVEGGKTMKIASTTPNTAGEPSDPEDIEAIENKSTRISNDEGVVDVTMPLLNKKGRPIAAAGIQIDNGGKIATAKKLARNIAGEIQVALR